MERVEQEEEQEVVGHDEMTSLKGRPPRRRGISTKPSNGDPSVILSDHAHEMNFDNNVTESISENEGVQGTPPVLEAAEAEEPEPTNGHGEVNLQSVKNVYLDREDGAVSKNGTIGVSFIVVSSLTAEESVQNKESGFQPSDSDFKKSFTVGINKQTQENLKEGGHAIHLLLSETSAENGTATPVDEHHIRVVKDNKPDTAEWDVEKVLEEQETHDLFCPKCKSCITKRVILRKRKRKGQDIGDDPRPLKAEILDQSSSPPGNNQDNTMPEHALDGNLPPVNINDPDPDAGPLIFRCLSCFSFFIPTVAGWKLFHIFREKCGDINVESTQQISDMDAPTEQDKGKNVLSHQVTEGSAKKYNEKSHVMVEKRERNVSLEPQEASDNIGFSSKPESLPIGVGHKADLAAEKRGMEQDFGATFGNDEQKLQRGDDVIVFVHEGPSASVVVNNAIPSELTISEDNQNEPLLGEDGVDGTRRFHGLEILKSIVYSGLIESITSLGVVSSAAGGDATTLSIIALGLANLVGGLPIIAHSLGELKNEIYEDTNESNKIDRYQEILGERRNFWIHAMVAVLSYIVFGMVPVVTYGFSFRESDNGEYKLIAVAAVSLFCIILLAIGKAYVKKAPKSYLKTIMYFIIAGVTASGLSYVVGVLVKELLEKLGLFEPNAAAPAPPSNAFAEVMPMNPSWASY